MLLGVPVAYSLNLTVLKKNFRSLQFRLHPDKFSMRSAIEQTYSAALSSQINKAYGVLVSPLLRAQYLLDCQGVVGDSVLPPDFLMDMMELNEELDNCTSAQLPQLHAQLSDRYHTSLDLVANAFSKENPLLAGDALLARDALARARYFGNLEKSARERLV